ncbi:hypothetical protein ACFSQD_01835 [Flavihumibacter stibioxidans]|uniref:Uncharacterized protein n=1 Tax=Flavihumibacter stibioxidans TaxID=1834163 RepID=A0ABR7MB06_9BACT|nr:hypothetical protein [Flavihumibacter stibioxidans]MBC6492223.1 hypothetical protein [Flavihumibacter stibioxidans]
MNTPKYIGLISSETSQLPQQLSTGSIQNGYRLKKVLPFEELSAGLAASRYPGAEIVDSLSDIIHDDSIELVLVAGKGSGQPALVKEVMDAGKHVRIL